MTVTKLNIIMTQKPYFAPKTELLECNLSAVFCGSSFPATGEGGDAWDND